MSYINKIKDRLNIRRVGPGSGRGVDTSAKDLPLDHQLTFKRDADEEWKYRNGQILINDLDVEEVLGYETRDVRLWCGVSEALMDYKAMVFNKKGPNKSQFLAKVTAVQDKVLCNFKRLYDEKRDGIYLTFDNGEVLFNNFNVRAFLAMYHLRPTKKARSFLRGFKSQLALILVNKNATSQYERVHKVVQKIYEEVASALEVQPIETRCLPPGNDQKSA